MVLLKEIVFLQAYCFLKQFVFYVRLENKIKCVRNGGKKFIIFIRTAGGSCEHAVNEKHHKQPVQKRYAVAKWVWNPEIYWKFFSRTQNKRIFQ